MTSACVPFQRKAFYWEMKWRVKGLLLLKTSR